MNFFKFYFLIISFLIAGCLYASDDQQILAGRLLVDHDVCILVCVYDSFVEIKKGQKNRLRRRCTITKVLKGDLKVSQKIDVYTYFDPGTKVVVDEGEMRFLFFDKQKSYINGVELETGRGFLYSDELLKVLSH